MAVGSKGSSGGGGPRNQNKAKQVETTPQNPAPAKGTPKVSDVTVPVKTEVTPKTEPQKIQPTAEQLRLAQITASSRKDDPDIEEKVQQLVDLSSRSADACLSALYDADYDMERAIEILLEGGEDTWEVSGKKKKQKPAKPAVPEPTEEELQGQAEKRNDISSWDRDDRGSRTRGGAPPRFRGRGRGRDGFSDGPERGRGGRGRGRGGARGGRGGYRGSGPSEVTVFDSPMETWGGAPQEKQEEELKVDNWGDDFPAAEDWDNEEYTVSLADTKVFTASSVAIQEKTLVTVEQTLPNGDKFHEPEPVKAPPAPVGSLPHQSHQSLDLNLLLQKSSSTVQQQNQSSYLSSYTQQASETLKAAIGVGVPSQQSSNSLFTSTQVVQGQFSPNTQLQQQRAKLAKPKLPPPSKIPSSAVEMPDDSVSQLDIEFGALEFGTDSAGVEFGSGDQNVSYGNDNHVLLSNKTESYGGPAPSAPSAPASQSQPKPSAFASATPTYTQQQAAYPSTQSGQTVSTASQPIASQATSTYQTSTNYQSSFPSGTASNYGSTGYSATGYPSTGYGTAPAAVNKLTGVSATQSYDTTTVTSSSTSSMSAGSFGLTPSVSAVQASAPASAPVSAVSQRVAPVTGSGIQPVASSVGKGVGMPPGVPTQMLGQYVMSQAPPGLPFAYAGLAQQPIYSMEDVQNMQYLQRYQQPMAPTAGYIDMPGFQSNTTALGPRDTGLAGYDPSKFQRNDNNSPVPAATTLTGQAGGTPYISPAAPTQLAAAPTYAYFYSNLPSGFQYGAPAAAIYPVSAATTGATVSSYKSPSASQAPYGYGGYDNSDYTKTAYVNQSMAKTASDMGVGASVHGKAAYQLGKSAYEKGFHTGTPPPFGMTGGSAAHLGNPVAAGYPQMFVPAMPHQSAASALIHQQLHGDSVNSQRASASAQAKGAPTAKPYGGSYWGN